MSLLRPNPLVVKLRGHHLLCILTYQGEGYSDAFTQNFTALIEQVHKGESVEIVTGIDDICGALQANAASVCAHASVCIGAEIKKRDIAALRDVAHALNLPQLRSGEKLTLTADKVKELRRHFLTKAFRAACVHCHWHKLCTDIAAHRYKTVRLYPHAHP